MGQVNGFFRVALGASDKVAFALSQEGDPMVRCLVRNHAEGRPVVTALAAADFPTIAFNPSPGDAAVSSVLA